MQAPFTSRRQSGRAVTMVSCALVVAMSATAMAKDDGIAGYSGKSGRSCDSCHSGGQTPVVELGGPAFVKPSETVSYWLKISGGQQVDGSLDVATDRGTLVATESGTKIESAELVHSRPRAVDSNGEVIFGFDYVAPATTGAATLWGAGLSSDGSGRTGGDRHDNDVFSIQVVDNVVRFEEYGSGLAGSGDIGPTLTGTDGDAAGGAQVHIADGLGGATSLLWVSLGQGSVPAFGGEFLIDFSKKILTVTLPLSGPNGVPGAGAIDLTVPDVSAAAGLSVYLQSTIIDPGAIQGVAFTNGLRMDIE